VGGTPHLNRVIGKVLAVGRSIRVDARGPVIRISGSPAPSFVGSRRIPLIAHISPLHNTTAATVGRAGPFVTTWASRMAHDPVLGSARCPLRMVHAPRSRWQLVSGAAPDLCGQVTAAWRIRCQRTGVRRAGLQAVFDGGDAVLESAPLIG
jgi:hypothetical protein